MTRFILFDTDILIDIGRGIYEAIKYLDSFKQNTLLGISVITQMELIVGCRNKTELRILKHFLLQFEIINMNEAISSKAANILHQYRLSHGLLIADALIASTALIIEVPIVTKNKRDYRFINGLKLLPYP